ncbi:MAG: YbaB/EbfC family nucleoid-associated protein [Candidatus Nitronauta litoralis]|uniref:Nucleoid-associated protein G3M70_05925 n=1 Tax=Candidatus Nitronauta litoralis TaxID=2705533 RepID=A0A7T0BV02_9BACT|nr:MAG: YbaB/EbfC family nucleoid-associated protein [Candidatus Nitronauta litoralis]
MFDKFGGMLQQFKDMQSKFGEVQDKLREKRIEASTGGGMVKVTANGLNEILSVQIDEELINMQDRAILEELTAGAMNEVTRQAKALFAEEVSQLTGGIKIPGLFG